MSESNPSKKPIEQAIISIDSLISDMQEIKNDISHIKQYIRKMEIRKEIEEHFGIKKVVHKESTIEKPKKSKKKSK